MLVNIECFWNGTIATNYPLTNSMLQQIFNIKNVGLPKHIFQVHNKTRFIFCVMISCDLYIFLIFLNNILQNTFFGSFCWIFKTNFLTRIFSFFSATNLNGFFTWWLKIVLCRLCHMWFSVRAKTVVWLTLQMVGNQNHIQYWAPLTET